MSTDRYIENAEARATAEQHELTQLLKGHLFHATTLRNCVKIIDAGCILVNTSRDGLSPRFDGAPKSLCMRAGAVSLFDFAVSDEDLFPLHRRLEGIYRYDMHWWNYLCKGPACVIIKIHDQARNSIIQNPGSKGQFIRGTEVCHQGDVPASLFTGFILRTGDLWSDGSWSVRGYDAANDEELIGDITTWLKSNDH